MRRANPVLDTTAPLLENPNYVFIDDEKIDAKAQEWASEDFEIPDWRALVFPDDNVSTSETIDFFMTGTAINFAYTDFVNGQKWTRVFQDVPWAGAFGMWASLKDAQERGIPITSGEFLQQMNYDDGREIFAGNFEIPMLKERVDVWNEVGDVLVERYGGRFSNLFLEAGTKLFDFRGKGIVERLRNDFGPFDDSVDFNGRRVRFDKKAQLGPAMLAGRYSKEALLFVDDAYELTVFADYVLPKGLRDMGILRYSDALASRVDRQVEVPALSLMELEIRAATIHAADRLIRKVNEYRAPGLRPINALHMDYRLWGESRKDKSTPHHLTKTIMY